MIYEFNYSFSELPLNKDNLYSLLGFDEGVLPEPFDEYVSEAIKFAEELCKIQGAFCIADNVEIQSDNRVLIVNEIEFHIGKTIAKELRNLTKIAFFICTAGTPISQNSQKLLKGENPVLGYVLDLIGSLIVEGATDKLQQEIKRIAAGMNMEITNRYSPGYCNWSVADQHKLFSFFPPSCCGISLSDSALMSPIKSVSGIIGLGNHVKFREYTCDLCSQTDCIHRKLKRNS